MGIVRVIALTAYGVALAAGVVGIACGGDVVNNPGGPDKMLPPDNLAPSSAAFGSNASGSVTWTSALNGTGSSTPGGTSAPSVGVGVSTSSQASGTWVSFSSTGSVFIPCAGCSIACPNQAGCWILGPSASASSTASFNASHGNTDYADAAPFCCPK